MKNTAYWRNENFGTLRRQSQVFLLGNNYNFSPWKLGSIFDKEEVETVTEVCQRTLQEDPFMGDLVLNFLANFRHSRGMNKSSLFFTRKPINSIGDLEGSPLRGCARWIVWRRAGRSERSHKNVVVRGAKIDNNRWASSFQASTWFR